MVDTRISRRAALLGGGAVAAWLSSPARALLQAAGQAPTPAVVNDLIRRMTLEEKAGQLQLMASDIGTSRSRDIAGQISALLSSPTHARLTGRRTAEQARARGLDVVDIDMAMPREFSSLVQQLDTAVRRADDLCRQDELLALASSSELSELRAWMTHQLVAQIERGEPPLPWSAWVSRGPGGPDLR